MRLLAFHLLSQLYDGLRILVELSLQLSGLGIGGLELLWYLINSTIVLVVEGLGFLVIRVEPLVQGLDDIVEIVLLTLMNGNLE